MCTVKIARAIGRDIALQYCKFMLSAQHIILHYIASFEVCKISSEPTVATASIVLPSHTFAKKKMIRRDKVRVPDKRS